MTAFDTAMATLVADANLSTSAEWQASAGGAWVALRVLISAPADLIPGIGGQPGRAVAVQATVREADVGQAPARNDLLRWGSPVVTYRVAVADPIVPGDGWRLSMGRVL